MGRLMRSPEGHDDPPASSLVSDPPADPPADPPKAEEPPADPPKADDPPKPAEPPKEEPPVVEPLTTEQLVLPEGFEASPELTGKFVEIINGDQSPVDKANALLALHGETLTAASEASSKAWDDMQTEWKDAAKADPDIGGAKLQPALTGIGKLVDEFGSPELRNVFSLTGAGNNVHMIKFLDKIANVLTEGNFFKASNPSASANDPDAAAKRMFPSMKG